MQAIAFEWRVGRRRRDVAVLLLALTPILLARELLLLPAPTPPGVGPELPAGGVDPVVLLQRGYQLWASVGSVSLDAFPIGAVCTGLLSCWLVASEFDTGTIRTRLVRDSSRPRLLVGKAALGLALSGLVAASTVLVGVAVPPAAHGLGLLPYVDAEAFDLGVIGTLAALVAVNVWAAATGLLFAVLVRSVILSAASFVGAWAVVATLPSVGLPPEVTRWMPTELINALLAAGAPAGSNHASMSGAAFFAPVPVPVALATLALVIAAEFAATAIVFGRRDITV
ncbi:MAG: ABC transporter permease subunit [Chloroflexi bacterium]|nr:ABC transporter permease subunit [Chloroflexota bacterium]